MTRQLIPATIAAVAAAAIAPSVAAASSVQVDSVSLSPSCAQPGQTITANVSVQNTTLLPQTFYAQDWVSAFGVTLERGGVLGSYTLPPLYTASESESSQIPSYTPYGYYTVNVGVGTSSSSPTSESSASAGLVVSPWCF